MEKFKKISIFSISLIITIYNMYLINRIWHFSGRITIMLSAFMLAALYLGLWFFKKKIDFKEILKPKKMKIILGVVSTIIASIVLITNFVFFTKSYRPTSVRVTNANAEIPAEMNIKYIIVDNMKKDVFQYKNGNSIEFNLQACKDATVVFIKDSEQEINMIVDDGNIEETIKLHNGIDVYDIQSNKAFGFTSAIRLIISFAVIEFITLVLSIASYHMFKKNKSIIIPVLLLILAIRMYSYSQGQFCVTYDDSFDYENTNLEALFTKGELQDRVPIYPIMIQLMKFICNDLWGMFLCVIQIIVSFISLIYLYKVLKLLVKWETLIGIIVFLYGISTAIFGWDTNILTESFSLSLLLVFCYLIISYIKKNELKYGIGCTILTFVMIFLKPSYLAFAALLFAFYLLKIFIEKDKENRKKDVKCLISIAAVGIFVVGYAFVYNKQYDILSITSVSARQNLYICINEGFYKNSGDEQFIKDIDELKKVEKNTWLVVNEIKAKYGNKKTAELVKKSRNASMKDYIKYLKRIILDNTNESFRAYNLKSIPEQSDAIYTAIDKSVPIRFLTIYLILIVEAVISIYKWIKNKKPDWIHLGLFGFIFAILVTTFIGTNAEFMRTALGVLPFTFMSIAMIVEKVVDRYKVDKEIS